NGTVVPTLLTERTVFMENSLHAVETEQVFKGLNLVLHQIDMFFFRIGLNLKAMDGVMLLIILPLAGYVMLRLFPYPFTAASHQGGEGKTSLDQALDVTKGWNIFPLLGVMGVFVTIHILTLMLFWAALQFFNFAILGSEVAIAGFERWAMTQTIAPVLRGGLALLSVGLIVSFTAFVAALQAGLGGALVRQARA
ncbi:MAG: hypothetical protein AAF723_10680, partial [Pseudomonadota bacterium]